MRPDPPLHRSLLVKLLGLTAFVLTCSIVTVAWLSAHLTAAGLSQQQGQALGDDIRVYTALVNYAATHDSWADVGPTLIALGQRDGRPVVLTTVRRQLIADSAADHGRPPALPAVALATIDPLNVNTTLIADTSTGQDPLTAQPQTPPTAAARQASGGDFSARVTVRRHDETGIVARAFNEMAEQRQQAQFQRKAMVNDIAHELRTPVSNIRGWLEAAEDGLSDPAEALASLREESLLLAHLIGDLQDLAAADAGELAIRAERVDLADILDNVAQAHRGTADAKGIRLTSRSPSELPVTADPIRLRQAVANLVGNAIRHTPADGTVTLTAWPNGSEVVIEVADTGPGIDPRHLPFLFERFWRADKSRSRQTGGSGLGLAIARQLAEAHHGTVSAANGDAGAVFTLRLPARQPTPSAGPEPRPD